MDDLGLPPLLGNLHVGIMWGYCIIYGMFTENIGHPNIYIIYIYTVIDMGMKQLK